MGESRLTFIRFDHFKEYKNKNSKKGVSSDVYNLYRCSCGKEKVIRRNHVKSGKTRSCGCYAYELRSIQFKEAHAKGTLPKLPLNLGNINGGGGKKGQKAHNKGKIFLRDDPRKGTAQGGTGSYVTPERLDAIHYGMEGEIHSLRVRETHNKGKKKVNGVFIDA